VQVPGTVASRLIDAEWLTPPRLSPAYIRLIYKACPGEVIRWSPGAERDFILLDDNRNQVFGASINFPAVNQLLVSESGRAFFDVEVTGLGARHARQVSYRGHGSASLSTNWIVSGSNPDTPGTLRVGTLAAFCIPIRPAVLRHETAAL
jgi:hypothetical protein